MAAQFRCGKCSKPVFSKLTKCLDCGFLGPHRFSAAEGTGIEGGTPAAPPTRRGDSYPSEQIDNMQPTRSHGERSYASEPAEDLPEPTRTHAGRRDVEDDSRFPVGMGPRSPILNHIDQMEHSVDKDSRKRHDKHKPDRDYEDLSDTYRSSNSYEDEEDEDTAPSKRPDNVVTYIVSAILVLVLVIAALYVYNNFDALTDWLASPTLPQFIRPSQ